MPIKKPEPGDDLLHLALREGVARADILSHPDNRELFARRNGAVLHEEDEIFVPEPKPAKFTVATGHTHYFVYKPPMRTLHLELRSRTGEPRQTDYTLQDFVFDQTAYKYQRPFPERLYGFAYQGIIHEELPAALKRASLLLRMTWSTPSCSRWDGSIR